MTAQVKIDASEFHVTRVRSEPVARSVAAALASARMPFKIESALDEAWWFIAHANAPALHVIEVRGESLVRALAAALASSRISFRVEPSPTDERWQFMFDASGILAYHEILARLRHVVTNIPRSITQ